MEKTLIPVLQTRPGVQAALKLFKNSRSVLLLTLTLTLWCFSLVLHSQEANAQQTQNQKRRSVNPSSAGRPLNSQPKMQLKSLTGSKGTREAPVLDFEADVIEGEGKKPDALLDFNPSSVTLDAIVYKRADFNDYLPTLQKARLRYQPPERIRH